MDFLVFQLQAALASWGDVAVGEIRGTLKHPGAAALVGLLGAALGIRRDDEAGHAALRDGLGFAVGTVDAGSLLRDYHTAQVPGRSTLKGRPHHTRRDELAVPKRELNTILSTRDYRQSAAWVVAVQALDGGAHRLPDLAQALRQPRFVLYLGRKCCPPAAPLAPRVLQADSAHAAITAYLAAAEPPGALRSLAWADGVVAGVPAHLSVPRKDRLIRRRGWQFGDRTEHLALLAEDA
ncbi:MAG: type I-E CRISPR-associated protein Cas5/CasD [Burkholderiales bacterium]|nr:type I-E CRISPR-associated protein Cas5/CasD [Burkholderiales bacterium]